MDFELHVVKGRSATQALKLMDGVNVVGRLDDCAIRIKSSQVSRKHCELFEKQGHLLVKDLKSANGTFVNGKKVEGQQVLEPGDELTIGSIRLRVAKVGQAPPVRPASGGAKASDTAVAEVVPASDDVEFEIDFDDEPATAAVVDDAIEFDFDEPLPLEIDEPPPTTVAPPPTPTPAAATATTKPAESKKPATPPPPAAEPAPAPASDMADEAIADFLLDIKLDEED